MTHLNMKTTDRTSENIDKIAQLFPNCITERLDDNGTPEKAIDFDRLRQELSKEIVEGNEERYQFTWPDKRNAMRLANTPTTMTLRPCREESVDFDNTENLYIEGDNLEVLKLLRENYLGKVKMIYIDPPYNTGNDFVYDDDFRVNNEQWSAVSGTRDEEGNLLDDRMALNTESNGRFHTDWLNMMYPRLKVARDLLSDDGVIFISIDDNEVDNLRKICDEIFGMSCFVANFIWEKRLNRENRKEVSVRHDYILCYSKSSPSEERKRLNQLPMNEKSLASYSNPDNDPRGLWKSDPAHTQGGHGTKSQFYTLIAPNGKKHELPSGRCWIYTEKVMQEAIDDNRIWFGLDGNGVPRVKTYLNAKERGLTPETILFAEDVSTNERAKNDIKQLFDGVAVFETPKPVELLEFIIKVSATNNSSLTIEHSPIILDFFSGSAATAHAVMQLNAEDGGSRKFIMVQLPEKTKEDSEAYKAGYKNICEIGKERIRRAGKKIVEEMNAKNEGLFAEQEKRSIDTGFRVLKLDTSNMADVYYTPEQFDRNSLFADNIKDDRTAEDLLFQVMPECNLPLSSKIEEKKIEGKTVFVVNESYLVACFDENIDEKVITEIAKMKPYYFVMRDSSMQTDNVADNFEQIFNAYSKETVRRVI